MPSETRYRQCQLQRGTLHTTGWIDTRAAKLGASVELLPSRELWVVAAVFNHSVSEQVVKDMEHNYRVGLPSTRDTGKDKRRGPAGR